MPEHLRSRALRGFVIVFACNVLGAFLGYLIRLFLGRSLQPEEYGLLNAVMTFLSLALFFADLGLSSTYGKYLPEFLANMQDRLARKLVRFVMLFGLCLTSAAAGVLWLLRGWISSAYFHNEDATLVLGIFLLSAVLGVPRGAFRSVFQGYQRHLLFASQYVIENGLLLLSLFAVFAFRPHTAAWAALAYLLAYAAVTVIFIPFFARTVRGSRGNPALKLPLRALFRFGLFSMLGSLGSVVILYTDTIFLTYYRPLAEVGVYNAVVPTVMLVNFAAVSVAQVLYPLAAELWARKDIARLRGTLDFIMTQMLVLVLPAAVLLGVFPGRFLALFFGDAYVSGAVALSVLSVAVFFIACFGIFGAALDAIGRPERSTIALGAGALLNLLLNILFIPRYGLLGAAITSLASYVLTALVAGWWLRREGLLSFPRPLPFLTALAAYLAVLFAGRGLAHVSILSLASVVLVAGLCYLFILERFGVFRPRELRLLLLDSLRRTAP